MSGMKKIFIQANKKQLLGAKIAQYAMETHGRARRHGLEVRIILVESVPAFQEMIGKTYRKGYDPYDFEDLQSFTLTRFMPPEIMSYQGRALVIDPDIFALSDVEPLFSLSMNDAAIAACKKGSGWDSSVMVLQCNALRHWNISTLLRDISAGVRTYENVIALKGESVIELSREWNSLDVLSTETKLLHTTNRLTQPWKTGLSIDFTINPMPKIAGIFPREMVRKLLGTYPTHYQRHPSAHIEQQFIELTKNALESGHINTQEIQEAARLGNVRKDLLSLVRGS